MPGGDPTPRAGAPAPGGDASLPPPLDARYAARALLGEGGFGRVVLAEDRELGRRVAVKVSTGTDRDPEADARFLREARVTARLEHPAIVRVLDSGTTDAGAPYIVYDHLPGGSLRARLEAGDLPGAPEVRRIGVRLAEALALAHDEEVVHRDVKPDNVLLDDAGAAVLCDFGIVRTASRRTVATAEGMILGTPAYLAPELLRGEAPSPASDQFALAATLAELLTGAPPYGTRDLPGILERVATGAPLRVVAATGDRHPGLDAVLERALAARPAARYPDLRAFARALATLPDEGGASPPARVRDHGPTRDPGPGPRPRGRRAASAAALLVVGAGLVLLARADRAPPPAAPPAAPAVPAVPPEDPALERARAALGEHLGPATREELRDAVRLDDARIDEILDPRVTPRWRRFVRLLAQRTRELRGAPLAIREEFLARVVAYAGGFQGSIATLAERFESLEAVPWFPALAEFEARRVQAITRRDELAAATFEVARDLAAEGDREDLWIDAVLAHLVAVHRDAEAVALLAPALDRALADPPSPHVHGILREVVGANLGGGSSTEARCRERLAFYGRVADHAAGGARHLPVPARMDLLTQVGSAAMQKARNCFELQGAHRALITRTIDALEHLARDAPGHLESTDVRLVGWLAAYEGKHFQKALDLDGPMARVAAVLARLRGLPVEGPGGYSAGAREG